MNICFINSTNKWGGVKSWTLDVALGLTRRGHAVTIVGRPGPFVEKAAELGLQSMPVSFGPDFNPVRIWNFVKLFQKQRINLVVVNVGKDMRTAGIAAKILDIPVIHRVGLAGDMLNTYKVRLLHKWIRPAILVPCQHIKEGMLNKLPYIRSEEITIIRTGKEPAISMPSTVRYPLRIVSTSQLNKNKGHSEILQALALLKNQGLILEYHIVGTGTYEDTLKEMAISLGVATQITWKGFQRDVRTHLRECDLFLLPSHVEGLPNSLLEAMAEGLPCVARNVGGVGEIWPDAAAEFLLPAHAGPPEFARALDRLSSLPATTFFEKREAFQAAAHFNTAVRMVDEVERFFLAIACSGCRVAGSTL